MRKTNTLMIIIITMIFISGSIFAQVTQEWVSFYNGPANDEDLAFSVAVDGSGNVYVTGLSWGTNERDFATIKYNSSGVQQWVQRYDGPGHNQDEAYSIAVDGSGNVYVTGRSKSGTTEATEDYATVKYNSSGVQQWVQRYNGPGNDADWPYSIAVDGSGNVYVTGWSTGTGMNLDYATIKYNSAGVQQWVQRYNGPGNGDDQAISLAIDNSGNVYVTGGSTGSGTGSDYATIKYNSSGVQQWIKTYNGPGNGDDIGYSIAVDGSGNVYATGRSTGSGTSYDYATIKYNSSGVQQWAARYNSSTNISDEASSVKVDGSGNVYVTGQCEVDSLNRAYTTLMYNSSGAQQWVKTYYGPKDPADWGWEPSLAIDNTGNAYVAAYSGSETSQDFAVIKYNSTGVQQWVQTYNGPGNGFEGIRSIAVDGSSNIYVTGTSQVNTTDFDYVTIKYSQSIGIQTISTKVPSSFSLYQNYPNPFNPSTKIKFDIPSNAKSAPGGEKSKVKIVIYDILGKEAAVLVNENLAPGSYEVSWDASNYPSGVYFYRLESEDFSKSCKMLIVK